MFEPKHILHPDRLLRLLLLATAILSGVLVLLTILFIILSAPRPRTRGRSIRIA